MLTLFIEGSSGLCPCPSSGALVPLPIYFFEPHAPKGMYRVPYVPPPTHTPCSPSPVKSRYHWRAILEHVPPSSSKTPLSVFGSCSSTFPSCPARVPSPPRGRLRRPPSPQHLDQTVHIYMIFLKIYVVIRFKVQFVLDLLCLSFSSLLCRSGGRTCGFGVLNIDNIVCMCEPCKFIYHR